MKKGKKIFYENARYIKQYFLIVIFEIFNCNSIIEGGGGHFFKQLQFFLRGLIPGSI